jgi:hypothetical protein
VLPAGLPPVGAGAARGRDRPGGIRAPGATAGSFWFYYKLGFRPAEARVRALAEVEATRLARRPGARSDRAMLRRLARSDMVLSLDGTPVERYRDIEVQRVGAAVTRLIERRYRGDRARALVAITRRMAQVLGVARVPERMAPVAALIPDLERWSETERHRLASILQAKEGRREGPYVLAMLRHRRFRRFLERFQ